MKINTNLPLVSCYDEDGEDVEDGQMSLLPQIQLSLHYCFSS